MDGWMDGWMDDDDDDDDDDDNDDGGGGDDDGMASGTEGTDLLLSGDAETEQ